SEFAEPLAEDPLRRRADLLGEALRGQGLHEHLSLAFCADEALTPFTEVAAAQRVRVSNPLREQLAVMRSHLLPGMLEAVAFNHARHDRPLGLYEIGRIYHWPSEASAEGTGPTAAVDARLPREPGRIGVIRAERRHGRDAADGAMARAVITDLLQALEGLGVWIEARPAASVDWLHPGVQIGLWAGTVQIGVAGELHPDLLGQLEGLEIGYGEIWLDRLPTPAVPQFSDTPRFPSSARDLSLDLTDAIMADDVVTALRSAAAGLAGGGVHLGSSAESGDGPGSAAVQALEDYRGKGVEAGRHALLLRLHYRADERSVTDAEVQERHDAIVSAALEQLRRRDPALRVR
ncbi:MAG: hypothetical protein KC457_30090, partial [Myxococcales bacterium]|nr:hypothetical protein [Myxococcales bacterium]